MKKKSQKKEKSESLQSYKERAASYYKYLQKLIWRLEQILINNENEFEQLKRELVNKAIDSGRAELSAMLLHNIGNAITPISIYTESLKNRNSLQTYRYLSMCYNDLLEHKDDLTRYVTTDSRGVEIMKYMGTLIENLEADCKNVTDIIDKIDTGINYVSQALTLQRDYLPSKNRVKERIDINLLIYDALKMQASSISKRNITLKKNLLETIPYIIMEKNRLMQVIVNLIKNSCDSIDEHKERTDHQILISTYSNEKHIGLKITDTGIGVEKERQMEIFNFGVSSKGSSGFGLYYCKSLIEEYNGTLTIESPGRGSGATVIMEIPYASSKINTLAEKI
ncbi:MAG: HAMP domain-containing histidine kinase [Desulfamplus sp.]|nr:HAMP domain-containing histidine kinase [Desulfamplus sp.]